MIEKKTLLSRSSCSVSSFAINNRKTDPAVFLFLQLESHQANARRLQAIDTCPCRGDRRRRRPAEKSLGKQQRPAAWRGEQQLSGQHRRVIRHGVIRHGPIPSPRLGCQGSGQKSGCAHVEPCAARVLR